MHIWVPPIITPKINCWHAHLLNLHLLICCFWIIKDYKLIYEGTFASIHMRWAKQNCVVCLQIGVHLNPLINVSLSNLVEILVMRKFIWMFSFHSNFIYFGKITINWSMQRRMPEINKWLYVEWNETVARHASMNNGHKCLLHVTGKISDITTLTSDSWSIFEYISISIDVTNFYSDVY